MRRLVLGVAGVALGGSLALHQAFPHWNGCVCHGSPETYAIRALRAVASAQARFRECDRDGDGCLEYASSIAELSGVGLIDDLSICASRGGYVFSLSGATYDWRCSATPRSPRSGSRNFIVCTDGVVRFSSGPDPARCPMCRGF